MSKTSHEVSLHELLEWAQEQSVFLRSPSERLVLWYLVINAFRYEDNPEEAMVGQVMAGRTSIAKIQRRTGLSKRAVQYALETLQACGYITADMKPGNGQSVIHVFWSAKADEMRADARDGIRALPKVFRGPQKTREKPLSGDDEGVVLAFPKVQPLHQ